MSTDLEQVDHAALRVNQSLIIGLNVAAFVADQAWLVGVVAVVMAIGTLRRAPGFRPVYTHAFRRLGWVKPDVIPDHREPHVFAQGLGAAVLFASVAALWSGAAGLGWALAWLVIALAALNLFAGFCAGCAIYYWMNRLGVPGFRQAPPEGAFPGMRPKGRGLGS